MSKTKILSIVRNIIWCIVAIETIVLINIMSNTIIENKNKITKLEKQIVKLQRGN